MPPLTVTKSDASRSSWILPIAGIYALLVALAIHHHEPWADEAQSWLLGRDSSLVQLWGRLLHYEGTPGLWQTLFHVLLRLGLPYAAYGVVSAFLSLAAVYILLRCAPLPLFIRILLPFTYYLCYQYAVVARSYALIAPLLFAIAAIYPQASRRPILTAVLLGLLAGVSVHGLILSVCIWSLLYVPRLRSEPRAMASAIAYWCFVIFFIVCAWPAKDVAFAEHRGFSNLHVLPEVARVTFAGAFTGYWPASLALIAFSLPLLWRGGGWLFFLLASAALCLFGALVYAQPWHFGMLFLAWIFAIWISAYNTPVTAPTLLALVAAIGFQSYWTVSAIRYDWTHAYSGSLAAAHYLHQQHLTPTGLYTIGYPTTAIQPYFPANPMRPAYWDWSTQNTANDPGALFASSHRDIVLVGYKAISERKYWADLLTLLGYDLTQHFDGDTFWQTGILECESFDLYRKNSNPRAASSVNMTDPAQAPQLLNGFYGIEGGKSRWTAKTFSVLLKAPPGSDRNGAELTLQLYIPGIQLKNLGALTLSADAQGHQLPAQTFRRSDLYTYSAHIPAEAFASGFVAINFRLDKAAVNLNGDARELGLVVTAVSLGSPSQPR